MKRRDFIGLTTAAAPALAGALPSVGHTQALEAPSRKQAWEADLAIIGGGLGGVAAALAALRNGLSVILTEETDWLGGQLTAQGVPPDEHPLIETHGAPRSYRALRQGIRDYYRRHYPLTDAGLQDPLLNPGRGSVSRLCHEPTVAHAVIREMLAPWSSSGRLRILTEQQPVSAEMSGNRVIAITVRDARTNKETLLSAPWFADATELGDLLPLTGCEYVTGTESKTMTGELHAADTADPKNHQSFTMCFAMDYCPGEDHVIEKPTDFSYWRDFVPAMHPPWPGKLLDLHYSQPSTLKPKALGFHPEGLSTGDNLNLWIYRRILDKGLFKAGTYKGDLSLVNWPQNDYMKGNLIDVSRKEFRTHVDDAKQLSLSLLYWLQTEAPRPDGGKGWRGLRLRPDVMGTADGLAKYPYVRESRRIKALFTVDERHCGKEQSGGRGALFHDSVGIGYYHIDLHPSNRGTNYIDFPSVPFQIPLGALTPIRLENLLPAGKNIGTTHITNGCYRLHPVEWSIGEAVGCLAAFSQATREHPRAVREDPDRMVAFQRWIQSQGLETAWG